jgi:hypothetical protein
MDEVIRSKGAQMRTIWTSVASFKVSFRSPSLHPELGWLQRSLHVKFNDNHVTQASMRSA